MSFKIDAGTVGKVSNELLQERVIDVSRISSGLHNYNFIVNTVSGKLVAKVPGSKRAIEKKEAKKQYNFLKTYSSKINVPKAILYSDKNLLGKPILYSEFISGKHINLNKLSPIQIKNFAREISKMHSIDKKTFSKDYSAPPVNKGTLYDYANKFTDNSVFKKYKIYSRNIEKPNHKVVIDGAMYILKNKLSVKKYSSKSIFSLLHTDIGEENIIWKGNVPFFIDWDEKIYGDPADEVGYIFAINNSSEKFRKLFLSEYLKNTKDKYFLERVKIYELKNRLFDVVWALGKLDKDSDTLKGKDMDTYRGFYRVRYFNLKIFLRSNKLII